jgi:Mpp10 protein
VKCHSTRCCWRDVPFAALSNVACPRLAHRVQLDSHCNSVPFNPYIANMRSNFECGTTGNRSIASSDVLSMVQEAKKLFTVLCAKLDALSHLSLAPKPVTSELEVRVDTPAIAMEDAAPVTMSAANTRAPEEVHAKVRKVTSVFLSMDRVALIVVTAECWGIDSLMCAALQFRMVIDMTIVTTPLVCVEAQGCQPEGRGGALAGGAPAPPRREQARRQAQGR